MLEPIKAPLQVAPRKRRPVVCHLISSTGLYGAETVILNLLQAMQGQARFDCELACIEDQDNACCALYREALQCGYPVHRIPVTNRFLAREIVPIRNLLVKRNVRLIHCHGYKASIVGYLVSLISDIRILVTYHLCHEHCDIKERIYNGLEWIVMKRAPRIVGVSEHVVSRLRGRFPDRKLTTIPNGTCVCQQRAEADAAALREELEIPAGHLVVGSLGRLVEQKGYVNLIRAAGAIREALPDVTFLVAGEGPLRAELQRRIDGLGQTRHFKLLGFRSDKMSLLQLLDVFVLPSLNEGLPMALLEAMATGLPCLVTDLGGHREVIDHGEDGFLVPPGQLEPLIGGLSRLIGDPDLRERLASNARRKVETRFSADSMRDSYLRVYEELQCA